MPRGEEGDIISNCGAHGLALVTCAVPLSPGHLGLAGQAGLQPLLLGVPGNTQLWSSVGGRWDAAGEQRSVTLAAL